MTDFSIILVMSGIYNMTHFSWKREASREGLEMIYVQKEMFSVKVAFFLYMQLSLHVFVSSHESRNHEHYSFKELQDAVNGDSLKSDDLQRLFVKLHFLNCSENQTSSDNRKVTYVLLVQMA